MKRREPVIVQEGAMTSAPDLRRAARIARLALMAAAAVPSCHRGNAPTVSTANAPTNDASTVTATPTRVPTFIAEQRPETAPDVTAIPAEPRAAVPPAGSVIAEARVAPPVAELRVVPHRHPPPRHQQSAELRMRPYAEDMPSELSLKPTRRGK